MKRKTKVVIAGSCIIGVLGLSIKFGFDIPTAVFWRYYLIFAGIVLIGIPVFNICYNMRYSKKVNAVMLLWKDGRLEEYIAEMETIWRHARGYYAKSLIAINLSAGYSDLKQYDKAIKLLESISDLKQPKEFRPVYCLNLCYNYFNQNQTEHAMKLYEDSQEIFRPCRNNKMYGGLIAVLDIYAAIHHKDYGHADELLQAARSTWEDPRLQNDYCLLEEIIQQSQAEQKI